ncbi:hypothetical protein [Luteolibacter sp. LG18]|uniref:hypothetical protein n=1 Tax=Luteolibacter sp. LG18 TaxID=2819286 RepID=UPI002B2C5728|nr:hypothetical protein llg_42170 [Luteolibacter sp. LG18]
MTGAIDPYQQREFRCGHCNGRIVIPIDLPPTTGPCPHCGGVITSPAPVGRGGPAPVSQGPAPVPAAAPPVLVPAPQPAATPAVAPAPAPVPAATVPSPAAVPQIAAPPVEKPAPEKAPAKTAAVAVPGKPAKRGLIPALLLMLVLIVACGAGTIYFLNNFYGKSSGSLGQVSAPGAPGKSSEEEFLRMGWQREAYKVLRGYTDASTSEGKAPYIVGGKAEVPKLHEFYGGGRIDDSDTPPEAFSVYELSMEDRKRGLFLMIYDQPPQFEMREFFRPLASLEVQYGLEDADLLLSSVARASNFAMEPVRVQAFFKRFPDGLRLDWDMFAQTKYRTLRNFVETPSPGQKAVFRVFVVEDVGDEGKSAPGTRTYRVADPATTSDSARIRVKVDSEAGRALSSINWRGSKDSRPQARTATVELEWVGADDPQLTVSRFICWEFLGLGGQETAQAGK